MVTEDFVSYEVAKLLKEKGFDSECDYLYANGNILRAQGFKCNWNKGESIFTDYKNECSAPTLQMAMKWLREVHNLSVEVYRTACGYIGCIVAIPSGTDIKFLEDDDDDLPSGQWTTYEKACNKAIKYCLENLI